MLAWGSDPGEIVFLCPCGGREVYVTCPPHEATFDDDGRLTLNGSCGSRPVSAPHDFRIVHGKVHRNLPANWCHFWMKDGETEMVSDARCPGRVLPGGDRAG